MIRRFKSKRFECAGVVVPSIFFMRQMILLQSGSGTEGGVVPVKRRERMAARQYQVTAGRVERNGKLSTWALHHNSAGTNAAETKKYVYPYTQARYRLRRSVWTNLSPNSTSYWQRCLRRTILDARVDYVDRALGSASCRPDGEFLARACRRGDRMQRRCRGSPRSCLCSDRRRRRQCTKQSSIPRATRTSSG
jgi:hypothetical protein